MTGTDVGGVRAVLFDMGGVLVQLDSLENVLGPSALGPDEIWEAWILSDAVQRFERGQCSVDDFAATIIAEMQLLGTTDEFIERFVGFPRGLYPGAEEVVAATRAQVTTAVLSNTSALHWEHQRDAEIVRRMCDRAYLSYELGLAKPDREIFDHAVADLGMAPGEVLFIDDNRINVDGARAAGLRAEVAKGPEQAAAALRRHGIDAS